MEEYLKKKDVIKAMEDNAHMIDVYGTKRKMIDGMMMCMDIADMESVELEENDLN